MARAPPPCREELDSLAVVEGACLSPSSPQLAHNLQKYTLVVLAFLLQHRQCIICCI